jgi:hypothetical protein
MLTTWHPLPAKVGNHFADEQRLLGRYSLLADSDHGVCLFFLFCSGCVRLCSRNKRKVCGARGSVVVKALCYTSWKVAGSRLDEVNFLNIPNPFGRPRSCSSLSL